jgi:uncharacterized membrane protein
VKQRSYQSAIWRFAEGSVFALLAVLASFFDFLYSRPVPTARISHALVYVVVATVLLSSLISFFAVLFRKRSADVSRVKREVVNAFLNALNHSPFNPHRFEDRYEQSDPQPAK